MRRTEVEWMVSMVNVLFKLYYVARFLSHFHYFYFLQELQTFVLQLNEKVLSLVHDKLQNKLMAKQEKLSAEERTAKLDFSPLLSLEFSAVFLIQGNVSKWM